MKIDGARLKLDENRWSQMKIYQTRQNYKKLDGTRWSQIKLDEQDETRLKLDETR